MQVSGAVLLLAAGLCFCAQSAVATEWVQVSHHVGTFLPGINFLDANNGWVCGFALGEGGPAILKTTNGGANWTASDTGGLESIIYMSIAMSSPTVGVAAGFGLPIIPGISVTADGNTWVKPKVPEFLETTFLDTQALNGTNLLAFGQWDDLYNKGEGLQISTDGHSFQSRDWAQNNGARYGSFINSTYGFEAGGNIFPLMPAPTPKGLQISPEYTLGFDGKIHHRFHASNGSGIFEGVIAKTEDGGRNWKQLFNSTAAGYNCYFNGISFVDANNGWVTAHYKDLSSGAHGSYIFYTNNGGKNWTLQLKEEHVRLFRVRMLDQNNGWAVGYQLPDLELFSAAIYHTTNGGKMWTRESIAEVFAFDIAVVDVNTAYLTGFALDFSTNVYKWLSS